ncbi:unnamed protein product [Schistosoma mattheei]|uniref:Uncharacterized protein n=1 Tax=Schistosoma mattheei TaxID=31246 RepID=A0A183PXL3_9TREM|nr:unnamed protein product [Schistosoma mattheei]
MTFHLHCHLNILMAQLYSSCHHYYHCRRTCLHQGVIHINQESEAVDDRYWYYRNQLKIRSKVMEL